MRPETFEEMVGQTQAKEVVKVLIKSSQIKNESVPHILFSGKSGNGKTTLAKIVAKEINGNIFSLNCATVKNHKQLLAVIDDMCDKDVLFLDEIHSLPKSVCESLYTIMEDFCYSDNSGFEIPISKITIIGASTEIGYLPDPLKRRFKFIAEFVDYTLDELVEVCYLVCRKRGFTLNKNIAEVIANTCKGNPSKMVNRTEWIYSYMISNELKTLKADDIINIIGLQGVNKDGLENKDIQYLEVLKENGALSLRSLAQKLNLDAKTVEKDVEPYLNSIGLFQITKKGRELTKKGILYVKNL